MRCFAANRGRSRARLSNLRLLVVGFAALLSTEIASAQQADWPQWRGPARDGVAPGVRLPRDWLNEELKVRWRVPLGEGYATPLVSGDRVYSFGREGAIEVAQAHELTTGRVKWRAGYPAKYEEREMKGAHGFGPRATPLVHDGRLFTYGINEVLSAIDTQTGRLLWRVDFPKRFATEPPGYGASSSPMIAGRYLILPAGNRVFALDYHSGSVIWNTLADSFYASIIQSELNGQNQLIAFTRYRLAGLDPKRGRLLWSMQYPSLFGSNIATPVAWNDRVVISSSTQGTRALRVRKQDGRWTAEPVWQTKAFRAYLTSPVIHHGHVYGLDESGMLFCLDLKDGRTMWSGGNFSDFGTMVLVGDQLLILTGYGELTAVEATPTGYRELGQRQVADSATWTHLAVARGCLFVRDKEKLTCFELEEKLKELK
jgi:outer membrane protein assembly factor BamB